MAIRPRQAPEERPGRERKIKDEAISGREYALQIETGTTSGYTVLRSGFGLAALTQVTAAVTFLT
jgi:hypothetical protein